ncbi:hypothetical protein QMG83_05100 [Salinibacterium sp. G-O1]|uniref:hypothetical protein n=1 Tax=Salinibacterium sp. G-O1 TaxID=3046208 RepID=UPI0024BA6504|nr:hypothetical protein [Salinibacterium sp. G-O1]MDJ0334594.1 hypothetical protein [Salinibacterium sp. G-O1]
MSLTGFGLFDVNGDGVGDNAAIDQDGDGYRETLLFDTNGDGIADVVRTDTDLDGITDTDSVDRNFDGNIDAVGIDRDHNGIYERIDADQNFDGVIDAVLNDANQDGIADPAPESVIEPSSGGSGNLVTTLLKLLENPNLAPDQRAKIETMIEQYHSMSRTWL